MLAFPSMLVEPAIKAGMKVPEDSDNFDPNEYPHFQVFCLMQLGSAMPYPSVHWDNAFVIASIPEDKIKTITVLEIIALGFHAVL